MDQQSVTSDILAFRKLFRNIDEFTNYQWGGYSSKPAAVLQEVQTWQEIEGILPSSPEIHQQLVSLRESCREKLADWIHCSSEEIALTEHTTAGINIISWGIPLKKNDLIILSKHEHPGNILPWYAAAQRFGAAVVFLDALHDEDLMLEQLVRFLKTGKCKVISVSHISRNTGYRLPVKRIAAEASKYDVFFLVDGAQSAGNIPVDVQEIGCDAYTFCGHKWMFAPQGTGALYIRSTSMEKVKPSWIGSKSQIDFDYQGNVRWKPDMTRFEYGTIGNSRYAGWLAAIDLLENFGLDRMYTIISESALRFKQLIIEAFGEIILTPIPPEESSGIFTIDVSPFYGADVSRFAWRTEKIQVSSLDEPHQLRLCSHFINTENERLKFIRMMKKFFEQEN